MPKIDSLPLSPTVSRILEAFAKKFKAAEFEALRQADHLFQSLLHRAFNGDL
jgi:hypothetical protein